MAIDAGIASQLMPVEVAYATPERQMIITVRLPLNASAQDAIEVSGILTEFPDINLRQTNIGIFGKVCELNQLLKQGDRVEIYRPLVLEPKAARLQRAAK